MLIDTQKYTLISHAVHSDIVKNTGNKMGQTKTAQPTTRNATATSETSHESSIESLATFLLTNPFVR